MLISKGVCRANIHRLISTNTRWSSSARIDGEEGPTQVDLLKKRIEEKKAQQKAHGQYWHEEKIAGETRRWNWRSEFVARHGLNGDHTKIWVSFGVIIIVGFGLFVTVKGQVIENRREQMKERQRVRKELEHQFGVVSN